MMSIFVSESFRNYFAIYAETCFASFGDRVKHWLTINEPLQTAINGYGAGIFAPGRSENSSTEPYLAAHYQLLAHAAAVSIYKKKFKVSSSLNVVIHIRVLPLYSLLVKYCCYLLQSRLSKVVR